MNQLLTLRLLCACLRRTISFVPVLCSLTMVKCTKICTYSHAIEHIHYAMNTVILV